eukprot:jgi/Chlat1/4032/Chrsp26S04093
MASRMIVVAAAALGRRTSVVSSPVPRLPRTLPYTSRRVPWRHLPDHHWRRSKLRTPATAHPRDYDDHNDHSSYQHPHPAPSIVIASASSSTWSPSRGGREEEERRDAPPWAGGGVGLVPKLAAAAAAAAVLSAVLQAEPATRLVGAAAVKVGFTPASPLFPYAPLAAAAATAWWIWARAKRSGAGGWGLQGQQQQQKVAAAAAGSDQQSVVLAPGPITLQERWNYFFEGIASSGPKKAAMLLMISTLIISSGAIAWTMVTGDSLGDAAWAAFSFVAAPDNRELESLYERLISAALTLGGFFSFALLVGVISDTITEHMDAFKAGRTRVLEQGHTLIVGFTASLPSLLRQIAIAHATEGPATFGPVVILGRHPKEDMDRVVADALEEWKGRNPPNVITREYDGSTVHALAQANAVAAKRVLILPATEMSAEDNFAAAVPSLLALRQAIQAHPHCELARPGSVILANDSLSSSQRRMLSCLGGPHLAALESSSFIDRLLVACTQQSGLSLVYALLLSFEWEEFHVRNFPTLTGQRFGEVWPRFVAACICGVCHTEGGVLLNPPEDYVLQNGDNLVYVSEEADAAVPLPSLPKANVDPFLSSNSSISAGYAEAAPSPQEMLVCGWRPGIAGILQLLDEELSPGSTVTLLTPLSLEERAEHLNAKDVANLRKIAHVRQVVGSPMKARDLRSAGVASATRALVLFQSEDGCTDAAVLDARLLSTLILMEDLRREAGRGEMRVVAETADPSIIRLVPASLAADMVASATLVAGAITQIASEPRLERVFSNLFDAADDGGGARMALVDYRKYAEEGETVTFSAVSGRARAAGDIALGYRRLSDGELRVELAPRKTDVFTFIPGDSIVVLTHRR